MPPNKDEIRQLVFSPSLGAVVYQANVLIEQLNRITVEEFPLQAFTIREILLCYAERCRDELVKLYNPDPKAFEPLGGSAGAQRVRVLGEAIRKLYAYVRYLLASSPRQSPPALQVALRRLVDTYFPSEDAGTPLCVVRPQWKYNLEYVPLTSRLRKIVAPSVLDPDGNLGISNAEEILVPWWRSRREKLKDADRLGWEPPKHLAVLSFAGLDTGDSLCFPLLAHEVGHFLAFSSPHSDTLVKEIERTSEIRPEHVQRALRDMGLNPTLDDILSRTKKLYNQTSICIRELLADLLATRMMGLSFFLAQGEFLKTLVPWSQPRVLSTGYPAGYPGIKTRLWAILRHLLLLHPHNPKKFLANRTNELIAQTLIDYLDEWSRLLEIEGEDPPKGLEDEGSNIERAMGRIAFQAVKNSFDDVTRLAQHIVPDSVCAELTPSFFERIAKLVKYLPPSCENESSKSFSEIMSAAWAYQILYGEDRERVKITSKEKYLEYVKTCNLVLKAIEILPASEAIGATPADVAETGAINTTEWVKAKGVLSASHIRKRIKLPLDDDAHLAVLPFNPEAIKGASLDVHLGNWFTYARRAKLSAVRIDDPAEKELLTHIGREEVFIEKEFLLHPGDLVLGATQEFIGLPSDVMAFVEGKSGLGRLGLFVATATQVAPGYHGVIVLELANAGTVPLKLSPGMRIAQLVFQVMSEKTAPYDGEYQCQIKP